MTAYTAPVRDMKFVIEELANLSSINQLPGLQDATADLVEQILEEASRMASEVLAPINQSGDQHGATFKEGNVYAPPGFKDAYQTFVESGWPALPFDPDRGGQGLPEMIATAVNEMWQSANMAWSLCPMLTEGAVITLETHASKDLKDLYLPKLISGEWTCTMNLTESQAGSDLAAIKTRAKKEEDHYLITGQKIFITWGDHDLSENILHLVLARLADAPPGIKGISLFIVPKFLISPDGSLGERNDVTPVSIEHKLGIHASPTCVMSFGDQHGAIGYLVGEEHNGLACMFTMMNHARLAVGVQGLGISERAYQQALSYAKERVQGKSNTQQGYVTIIHHPDVRRMLMLMKAGTEAMRALCYVTASSLDYSNRAEDEAFKTKHLQLFALLTPAVKGWCSELSQEIASLGVQIHGGMGYIEETGAAQHLRDARITTIYEGTTGIQALDLVGRKIIRDKGKTIRSLLDTMRETADSLSRLDDNNSTIIHSHYIEAIEALTQAVSWLLDNYKDDINAPGAISYNFMMLTGTVCGGWQMAQSAIVAYHKLNDASDSYNDFYRTKQMTARFYAEHILPRASSYLKTILTGSESIMSIETDQF